MKTLKTLTALMGAVTLAGCVTANPAPSIDAQLGRMLAGQSQMQGGQLEQALAAASQHPLGSRENPVRASTPTGQRSYLTRLRCADGTPPEFRRSGNLGAGVYGNIIDAYDVVCVGKAQTVIVMDMYHAGYVEERPVGGFTITDR